ncbi:MAG: hypothetical protein H6626_03955 [Pseudobdellovibrionaceae bacterium]|nr:hypothetical protein [Bdellovibrionales bacterium]USN48253.1 MAG: hypothetical protein H6626_03955 [Pseudobdellovibrionaceae bacterium]
MENLNNHVQVTTFYKFIPLTQAEVSHHRDSLLKAAEGTDLKGLFIMGKEGVNSTYAGPREQAENLKQVIETVFGTSDITYKDSFCDRQPFNDFKVKVRDEIVTIGRPDLIPHETRHNHLCPDEWDRVLKEEDVVCIDTRNDYEFEVGHFKGALNPDIKQFTDFPDYIRNANIPKDKKVLIYCTGGIRCEKAILDMEDAGYTNVFQLEGGILNYLKSHPHQEWEGECFVFDYRVAVDQELNPSHMFKLCPHCGQPAKETIQCLHCHTEAVVCAHCLEKDAELYKTCSKNCAHHYHMGHRYKKPHFDAKIKRGELQNK